MILRKLPKLDNAFRSEIASCTIRDAVITEWLWIETLKRPIQSLCRAFNRLISKLSRCFMCLDIWAASSGKALSSIRKMCRFTSSCAYAKDHPGI